MTIKQKLISAFFLLLIIFVIGGMTLVICMQFIIEENKSTPGEIAFYGKIYTSILIISMLVVTTIICVLLIRKIINPINDIIRLFKQLANDCDLSAEIITKKVNCSEIKNCNKLDCQLFGKETNECIFIVGSEAPYYGNEITCPSILNGKYKSCEECEVMKSLIVNEFDRLKLALYIFIARIKQTIKLANSFMIPLSIHSTEISTMTNKTSSTIQEQSVTVEEISATMEELSAANLSIKNNIKSLNVIINTLHESLKTTKKDNIISEEKIKNISIMQKDVMQYMDIIQISSKQTIYSIKDMKQISDQVMTVIENVSRISDKVNLLSLNASIESARAGEHGKGFAVVANEIGILAEKTQESVDNISKIINSMIVSIMDTDKKITRMLSKIEKVILAIDGFIKIVKEVKEIVSNDIKSKELMEECTEIVKDQSNNIFNSINEHTDVVSETSSSMEQMSQGINEILESIMIVQRGTEDINRMSNKLKYNLDKFKV